MKHITATVLLFGICLGQSIAEETNTYAPAEPYRLSTNEASCFFSDHLTGARYMKFSPDGQYVRIAKEHMGVWPFDDGTWTQAADLTITMVSTNLCADIISGPLGIRVGRHEWVGRITELRRKVNEFLASSTKDSFSQGDLKGLSVGEYSLRVEIDWRSQRKTVTRPEMLALLKAIDDFINDPSIRNKRLMPLEYKGKVFLVNLNDNVNRDHKKVCEAIDQGTNSQAIIYNDFMVSEEQFTKGTGKPYSFKYHTEMNKITGAE